VLKSRLLFSRIVCSWLFSPLAHGRSEQVCGASPRRVGGCCPGLWLRLQVQPPDSVAKPVTAPKRPHRTHDSRLRESGFKSWRASIEMVCLDGCECFACHLFSRGGCSNRINDARLACQPDYSVFRIRV
jgi:hypothetical protein